MPTAEAITPHVAPFLLVVFRLAGLFLLTPLLAQQAFPRRFRALLAFMLGAAVYAGLPPDARAAPDASLASLPGLIVGETLIGATIGFVASLPIMAAELAGLLMGTQIGFGLARVYNPEAGTETDVLGHLLVLLALALFVAVGGLDMAFRVLVATFERVPLGGLAPGRTPLDLIVGVLASGFDVAMRIAAPVLCIVFLLLLAMGVVSKTMPQINILSVGLAIKILVALAVLAGSVAVVGEVVESEIDATMRTLASWTRGL